MQGNWLLRAEQWGVQRVRLFGTAARPCGSLAGMVSVVRLGGSPIKPIVIERAPAKVNLALAVLRRREDGYHDIDSLMHSLDLSDRVTVEPTDTPGIEVVADHDLVPTGPDNLGAAAAWRLAGELGIEPALRITIDTRIPVAAGLAGGSAVAAAVLRACCRLWGVPPDHAAVARVARATGADVTFCLRGGAARARGIGDLLQPLRPWQGLPVVLIAFPFTVSTRWVYEAYDDLADVPAVDVDAAVDALLRRDPRALGAALANALEAVTATHHPEVAAARAALLEFGALGAAMSGSGPSVYGIFADEVSAEAAVRSLNGLGYRAWLTRLSDGSALAAEPAPNLERGV